MKGEKSWTRQMYENHYRWLRCGLDYENMVQWHTDPVDTMKAADYSYQACNIDVHGWSSNIRQNRFWQIKWRVYAKLGEIPF